MRHLVTILAGLVVLLGGSGIVAWASGPVGFVAAHRGEAYVIRGESVWPARVGMEVMEVDKLRTGPKSRLKVLFSDDIVLALGADTEVVVSRHLFDPASKARSTRINMVAGTLRALVQKIVAGNKADFTVQTLES